MLQMQTGRLLQSCVSSLPAPSSLGWPTLAKDLGSSLCFSHWFGKARKSANSPTVFPSTHTHPHLHPLLIQANGNWIQHSEICQIQPHCPCKIAPTESHRTVFRGLRSLCLVYDAWRKGWAVIRHGRGKRRLKPLCVGCISLWLNCELPLVNSGEHFSGELHNKSSGMVNNSGPIVACSHCSNVQPHRDLWVQSWLLR